MRSQTDAIIAMAKLNLERRKQTETQLKELELTINKSRQSQLQVFHEVKTDLFRLYKEHCAKNMESMDRIMTMLIQNHAKDIRLLRLQTQYMTNPRGANMIQAGTNLGR